MKNCGKEGWGFAVRNGRIKISRCKRWTTGNRFIEIIRLILSENHVSRNFLGHGVGIERFCVTIVYSLFSLYVQIIIWNFTKEADRAVHSFPDP